MKVKPFFVGLLALIFTTFVNLPVADAVVSSAQTVRLKYNSTNVTTSAYVELIHSLSRSIQGISIFNSGSVPMQLAIGPAGSEVVQMTFPSSVAYGNYFPLQASQTTRISVIALDNTSSTGELQLNAFFN